jgi:Transglycosylase SLT domain
MQKTRYPVFLLPYLFLIGCASSPVPITHFYHEHTDKEKHWHPPDTHTRHYHPQPINPRSTQEPVNTNTKNEYRCEFISPYVRACYPISPNDQGYNRNATPQGYGFRYLDRSSPERVQREPRRRYVAPREPEPASPPSSLSPIRTPDELIEHLRRERAESAPRSAEEGSFGNPNTYDELIVRAARSYQVDPSLIKAVMHVESAFNPRATSHAGARGLMQLVPDTAQRYGVRNIYDPEENVYAAVRYIRDLMDRFNNNVRLVLAAYNAGESAVIEYRGVPPYVETRAFVQRVLYYMRYYRGS